MSFINSTDFWIYFRFLLDDYFFDDLLLNFNSLDNRFRPEFNDVFFEEGKLFLIVLHWQINLLDWIVGHRIELTEILE